MNSRITPGAFPQKNVGNNQVLIVNRARSSADSQVVTAPQEKPTRTNSTSNTTSGNGSGNGYCRVRRTASGLEVGLARPKGFFARKKTPPKIDWVTFSNAGALANTESMQHIAKLLSKQLTRGVQLSGVAGAIGRAASSIPLIRNTQLGKLGGVAPTPEDDDIDVAHVWAQMLVRSGLLSESQIVCEAGNQRTSFIGGLFDQLTLSFAYTAMAVGSYFGDSSLSASMPTLAALTGLAHDAPTRERAILMGLLSGAVAAGALQQHLPVDADVTVLTRFKVESKLSHEEKESYWRNRSEHSILDHEIGKAELYVDVVNSITGSKVLEFPIAYETRNRLTNLQTGAVDDKSVNTSNKWPEMAAALDSIAFRRVDVAEFSLAPRQP